MDRVRPVFTMVVALVIAAGVAYAAPTADVLEPEETTTTTEVTPTPEETVEVTPTPTETEVVEEEPEVVEEEAEGSEGTNHGAAVSVAAHCPIKGRAHGALVSSVARDKDATPESAQAACDAAVAAQEAAVAAGTAGRAPKPPKPEKAPKPEAASQPAKPEKAPKPAKPAKSDDDGDGERVTMSASVPEGSGPGRGVKWR